MQLTQSCRNGFHHVWGKRLEPFHATAFDINRLIPATALATCVVGSGAFPTVTWTLVTAGDRTLLTLRDGGIHAPRLFGPCISF